MGDGLLEHFSVLKDPRIERNKLHQLEDILVLTVCAVAAGADGWEGISVLPVLNWL